MPTPVTERKARCPACRTTHVWIGTPTIADAICPRCGLRLARATYRARGRFVIGSPATAVQPGVVMVEVKRG